MLIRASRFYAAKAAHEAAKPRLRVFWPDDTALTPVSDSDILGGLSLDQPDVLPFVRPVEQSPVAA